MYKAVAAIDLSEIPTSLQPVLIIHGDTGLAEIVPGRIAVTPLPPVAVEWINTLQPSLSPLVGYEPYRWECHIGVTSEDGDGLIEHFESHYAVSLETDDKTTEAV